MTLLVYTTPDAATVSHKAKPQAAIETQLLLPSEPAQDTYVYTTQVFWSMQVNPSGTRLVTCKKAAQ